MIAWRCACWTASQTSRNSRSRSAIVDACVSQYAVSGRPSTYSITNQGVPSGSVSAS
jgi:hypothetical protein